MRECFALLGLPRDADERAIKRAYAQRLRATRPDEDPAGFQRLNEAYRRCLELATQRAARSRASDERDRAEDEDEAPAPPTPPHPDPVPVGTDHAPAAAIDEAPRYVRVSFDAQAFIEELLARMHAEPADALDAWLRSQEPLYSLELKHALHVRVAAALTEAEPVPPSSQLRAVMRFFDLEGVSADGDWLRRSLHDTLHRADEADALDREIARLRSPRQRAVDRLLIAELLGPLSFLRRWFLLLVPLLPSRLLKLMLTLEHDYPSAVHARLDLSARLYWRLITDRSRLEPRRLVIGMIRVPLYYAGMAGFVAALSASTAPFEGMALNCAALMVLLLAWMLLSTLAPRAKRYLERRYGWDAKLQTAVACFLIGLIASPWWTVAALVLMVVVGLSWSIPRTGLTHMASFLAMASGAFAAYLTGMALQGGSDPSTLVLVTTAAYAGALPVLHDLLYARIKHRSLSEARTGTGWLWWVLASHLVAASAFPIWIRLLRGEV